MEHFGTTGDGREVYAISLGAPGALQAQMLTYGGILRRLTFPSRGAQRDLALTLPNLDAYVRDTAFLGILVGRVANRIANAQFELNGRVHRLSANDGVNQLHGGAPRVRQEPVARAGC